MATVQDPTGAVVQFWQPKAHIGAGVKHEHGALTWAELLTTDQASAIKFYSKLLGLCVDDSMITGDGSPYNVFMVGEDGVAGCMTMPDDLQKMNIPSHWDIYFHVDDVDVTVQLASSKGADVKMQPTDIPEVGRIAYIIDPQGAGLGLITPEAM